MKLNVYEIFDRVQKSDNPKETLLELQNPLVKEMLKLNYCLIEEFDLPEGAPPIKTDKMRPIGYSETNLYVEMRRLYIFMKTKDLAASRKEQLFVNLLEGIHFTEAEVLVAVKDHKLQETFPALTEDLVNEVFPNLIQKPVSGKVKEEKEDPKVTLPVSSAESSITTITSTVEIPVVMTKEEKSVIIKEDGKPKNKGGRPKGSPNKKKKNKTEE